MKAPLSATAALVCPVITCPAMAQDAPETIAPEDRWVAVNDYPMPDVEEPKAESGSAIIRRAMSVDGLEKVFSAEDDFVARWLASEEKRGGFYLGLQVAPDGTIIECAGGGLEASDEPEVLNACSILQKRGKFVPALAADGTTLAGKVEINVIMSSGERYLGQTGSVIAHRSARLTSSPPPPPSGYYWPHRYDASWWTMPKKSRIKPKVAYGDNLPADAQWAGGALSDEPNSEKCRIQVTSIADEAGAEAFKREVCRWVEKEFKPRWARARQYNNRHPFLFVKHEGKIEVYQPGLERGKVAAVPGRTSVLVVDQLLSFIVKETEGGPILLPELRLRTDSKGKVSRCRIAATSGNDAVDIEACRILREEVAVEPATDIFGLPINGYLNFRFRRDRD